MHRPNSGLIFLLLFLSVYTLSAQPRQSADSVSVVYHFKFDNTLLLKDYKTNNANLQLLKNTFRDSSAQKINSIIVRGSSSPDGNPAYNKKLSWLRAHVVWSYLKVFYPKEYALSKLQSNHSIVLQLIQLVETDQEVPYKEDILSILRKPGMTEDAIMETLRNRYPGIWKYLQQRYFPRLRKVTVDIHYNSIAQEETEKITAVPTQPIITSNVVTAPDTSAKNITANNEFQQVPIQESKVRKPFYMAAKTDFIYDAALVPNIGVEFYIGKGWSVTGSWAYAWWNSYRKDIFWSSYDGELDIRKYFGAKAAEKPLQGQHISLYLQGISYDFETGHKGYQSKWSYGAGVEYGYSMPIGRRLNLDFGLGLGYMGGKYKTYIPVGSRYAWQSTNQRFWIGPTKAEVTLVWLLGYGNQNKKGGSR